MEPQDAAKAATTAGSRPNLTVPQLLAFAAFGLYAALALFANDSAQVTTGELEEMGTFTMFLIGAMLPSDALIRFGRNLLFQKVDDPDKLAKDAPATTLAQLLAFGAFVVVAALTFIPPSARPGLAQLKRM